MTGQDEREHKEIAGVKFSPWVTEHGTRKLTVESGRTVYPMNYDTAIAIHAYVESQRRPLLDTPGFHLAPTAEVKAEESHPRCWQNGQRKHVCQIPSGRKCIEGCGRDAGTAWGPNWCPECDVVRLDRVAASMNNIATNLRENGGA